MTVTFGESSVGEFFFMNLYSMLFNCDRTIVPKCFWRGHVWAFLIVRAAYTTVYTRLRVHESNAVCMCRLFITSFSGN